MGWGFQAAMTCLESNVGFLDDGKLFGTAFKA
jgi:hypothetical protein